MGFPLDRPVTDPTAPVVAASPKTFWRFEDDLTDDATVGPFDLTLTAGTETYADAGNQKTAFSFDGSTYLTAAGYTGITGSDPRAVSLWAKTTGTTVFMVGWGSLLSGGRWEFFLDGSGRLAVTVGGGTAIGTQNVADGALHHLVVVLESGDDNVNELVMYVDGALETISSASNKVINTVANAGVNVGSSSFATALYTGQLDEVAIFDGLTANEVLAIYRGGLTAEDNDYNYKESTDEWVTVDLPRSGGRYKSQLISVSDQGKVYFGAL